MKKIKQIFQLIGVIFVILLVGWLAILFKVNIGKLIRIILGNKEDDVAVVNEDDKPIGRKVGIVIDNNPFRDKTIIKTVEGKEIKLPKNVKDKDVKEMIKVGTEYKVTLKHEKLTDVLE